MSKYQALQNAIEAFQPGGAGVPIVYSTTEVNEKSFKALAGRKLNWKVNSTVWLWVILIVIVSITTASIISFGFNGTPAFISFFPLFFVIFFIRSTLVSVGEDSLDIYFLEATIGSNYVVNDKLNLPYDKIKNVKVRAGKRNTHLTFEFEIDGKAYKLKTSMANKMKKMPEQSESLKQLLEVLESKQLSTQ